MNKILTLAELGAIEDEIKKISDEASWLDPTIPGENERLSIHINRLEELEKILLTSLKNQRIKKVGLKVVQ